MWVTCLLRENGVGTDSLGARVARRRSACGADSIGSALYVRSQAVAWVVQHALARLRASSLAPYFVLRIHRQIAQFCCPEASSVSSRAAAASAPPRTSCATFAGFGAWARAWRQVSQYGCHAWRCAIDERCCLRRACPRAANLSVFAARFDHHATRSFQGVRSCAEELNAPTARSPRMPAAGCTSSKCSATYRPSSGARAVTSPRTRPALTARFCVAFSEADRADRKRWRGWPAARTT